MKQILGWVLWGFGLAGAIGAAGGAESHSQIYVDIVHETTLNSFDSIGKDELYLALDQLRDFLISGERMICYYIALLMGIGTILILQGRQKKNDSKI